MHLGKAAVFLTIAMGACVACAACSKLTEPAGQEPIIQSEQAAGAERKQPQPAAPSPPASAMPTEPAKPTKQDAPAANEKVDIVDLTVGKGAEVKAGDKIRVHYVGKLANGTEFDASRKHSDKGATFPIGVGGVIKGWDEGLVGMKVGGKRKLTIPPSLGYGPAGRPPAIPPNSTLVFEVELLEVLPK